MASPRRRSLFRPCIDLHDGQVKQIVGATLTDRRDTLKTNFVGGHVIMLGPGNKEAAKEALAVWVGGLQVGGGINDQNCLEWLNAGASKVIVTTFLFPDGKFSLERLQGLANYIGKDKFVVDVSCRKVGDKWFIATEKWQRIAEMEVCKESLDLLAQYCSEFLIHAADVEGLCQGIDEQLVQKLGEWVTIPTTYAGGAKSLEDIRLVDRLSGGKVDLTYGSALDIFGGELVKFDDLVRYNAEAMEQMRGH
ncbi:unnamed protein product [Somion occarium]|uniref:1-(5-phosphoribosyl)-5-[(5-phosphoribosylamino)methylideneamino] imidazole-4-carboxamide isomerase n=1 Tax=Somion occarium TaxID=3059160 RepID=A0ABP1CXZ3_9APHY